MKMATDLRAIMINVGILNKIEELLNPKQSCQIA